jgi:hypothetical protein
MSGYGRTHHDAKQEKLALLVEPNKCQVTGETGPLEAHHVVTRTHSGPDMASNYIMLKNTFHSYIHSVMNVTGEDEKFYKRLGLAKKLWNNPTALDTDTTRSKIAEIDNTLIVQYINNTLNNLSHHVREKVLFLTLVANFETIRDLNFQNHKKDVIISQLMQENKSLKTLQ